MADDVNCGGKNLKRPGPKPQLTPSERKRRKAALNKKYIRTRVTISFEMGRWEAAKKATGLQTDRQMATLLLDSYEEYHLHKKVCIQFNQTQSSTPAAVVQSLCPGSEVKVNPAEISGVCLKSETGISDLEETCPSTRLSLSGDDINNSSEVSLISGDEIQTTTNSSDPSIVNTSFPNTAPSIVSNSSNPNPETSIVSNTNTNPLKAQNSSHPYINPVATENCSHSHTDISTVSCHSYLQIKPSIVSLVRVTDKSIVYCDVKTAITADTGCSSKAICDKKAKKNNCLENFNESELKEVSQSDTETDCDKAEIKDDGFSGFESLDDSFADDLSDEEKKVSERKKSKRKHLDDEDYFPSDLEITGEKKQDAEESEAVSTDIDEDFYAVIDHADDIAVSYVVKISDNESECTYCPQVHSNLEDANAHMYTHYEFCCQDCDSRFVKFQDLKYHMKKHKVLNSLCQFCCLVSGCTFKSKTKAAVSRHVKSSHSKNVSLECSWCGHTSTTATDFNQHISSHYDLIMSRTNAKPVLCYKCGSSFRYNTDLNAHMTSVHGAPQSYHGLCDICGELCKSRSVYQHVIRKHTEKTIACKSEGCNLMYKADFFMDLHYKSVHLGINI